MKKKKLSIITAVLVMTVSLMGCSTDSSTQGTTSQAQTAEGSSQQPATQTEPDLKPDHKFKVGITIQSLENVFWAGVFSDAEAMMKEKGWESTIVDCKDNSSTQISQIENFITAGCDLIMVHASDPNAIEDVCKQARDAGIKIMCWDDKMTNTDINWLLDNTVLGYAVGSAAANFINEHYSEDNKVDVAIMNYPQLPILLERENGIIDALNEISPNKFNIVAQQPAIDAATALSNMETILQAHPNVKVVCSIGGGGDIGANQAFMTITGGNIPDDMGIFAADAAEQQLQAIVDGEASRVAVGAEGSNIRTAAAVVDLYEKLLTGYSFTEQNIIRPLTPIDKDNAADYLAEFK